MVFLSSDTQKESHKPDKGLKPKLYRTSLQDQELKFHLTEEYELCSCQYALIDLDYKKPKEKNTVLLNRKSNNFLSRFNLTRLNRNREKILFFKDYCPARTGAK